MDKLHFVNKETLNKRILILGFGREGQSTYSFLRSKSANMTICIADSNPDIPNQFSNIFIDNNIIWYCGPEYLQSIKEVDLIIKSPGIPLKNIPEEYHENITSQTEWFIRGFRDQIIGITGTKGKSTTSSLLYHILSGSGRKSLLIGNIGVPPLSAIDKIEADTLIVYELSCHQLHKINFSPATAIMLNIFQEHLDHYTSLEEYQMTKINIGLFQQTGDLFILNPDDPESNKLSSRFSFNGRLIRFSLKNTVDVDCCLRDNTIIYRDKGQEVILVKDLESLILRGEHNILNVMAAATAAYLKGITPESINRESHSFRPLEHRLELVGTFKGIEFYNDSISTIPESTVQALKTLKNVFTLIVGGVDRGISYHVLTDFITSAELGLIIVTGMAGRRIKNELLSGKQGAIEIIEACSYDEVIRLAFEKTPRGKICLLSPAAASYDWFSNFEARGQVYKSLIKAYK